MSRSITIHMPDETEKRMDAVARELGRDVNELAECAVAESALDYFRGRPQSADPARNGGIKTDIEVEQ